MGCSGPTGGLPISNIFKRNIPAMVCGTSEGRLPPAQNPIRASAGGVRARQTGQLADRAHHLGTQPADEASGEYVTLFFMALLRSAFLSLSRNRRLRRISEKTRLGKRLSSRFVAGMEIEEVL